MVGWQILYIKNSETKKTPVFTTAAKNLVTRLMDEEFLSATLSNSTFRVSLWWGSLQKGCSVRSAL